MKADEVVRVAEELKIEIYVNQLPRAFKYEKSLDTLLTTYKRVQSAGEKIPVFKKCDFCDNGVQYNPGWEEFFKTIPQEKQGDLGEVLRFWKVNREEDLPWEERDCPVCGATGKLLLTGDEVKDIAKPIFAKLKGQVEYRIRKQKIVADEASRLLDENEKLQRENADLRQQLAEYKKVLETLDNQLADARMILSTV